MISVIIRTRNEEQWIRQCLATVARQDYVDFEMIVVDNQSTDRTLQIASEFDVEVVSIPQDEFTYGRALNRGIEASRGDFICCLSGHCFPENTHWLFWLRSTLRDPAIAGVYGRQKPIQSTHPLDKRDLWTMFGPERKVQTQDPFFHNANAMIRRSVWSKVPFDEQVNGVEDRVWARQVLGMGYRIAYEPSASIYHPHGINQAGDVARAERIVKVLEQTGLNRGW
ncbi:MAG: glycosyltransferase family 2 protein [Planctomyces sp.]|nr:glycosyltransferase family 2 protein [Planctomyces sp.]